MNIIIKDKSHIGKVRTHNEDAYLTLGREKSLPGISAVLLVADGMGGHAAGDVASGMAKIKIHELFGKGSNVQHDETEFSSFLRQALQEVNRDVHDAARDPAKSGMGTTCTLAVIRDAKLFIAHVGDSRAYLLRDGKLCQITIDHSWVEEQVVKGSMTKETARVHPNRNIITRAIGLEPEVEIDTYTIDLSVEDLVLLASDGLTSMVSDEDVEEILNTHSLGNTCEALVKAANDAGGHDNTTVVLAEVSSQMRRKKPSQTREMETQTVEIEVRPSVWKRLTNKVLRRRKD